MRFYQGPVRRLSPPALWDGDLERRAGDVLLPPFDGQDVVPPLLEDVAHVVLHVAHVLDGHLLTGDVWSMDPHQQHVLTCFATVYREAAPLARIGLAQAWASTENLAGI